MFHKGLANEIECRLCTHSVVTPCPCKGVVAFAISDSADARSIIIKRIESPASRINMAESLISRSVFSSISSDRRRLISSKHCQTCFRPVAMMVPDSEIISEIILYSEGFEHAKVTMLKCFMYHVVLSHDTGCHIKFGIVSQGYN